MHDACFNAKEFLHPTLMPSTLVRISSCHYKAVELSWHHFKTTMGDVISTFLFQPPDVPTPIARSKVFWLETRLGSRIPAFFVKPFPGRLTILYSHGNAEDLGMLYDYLTEISRLLKVNIMAYDYTGYGLANIANEVERWAFAPSEEHCYADIEAAYHHLTEVENIEPATIILYGRSVGSGPSCYLAEKMFIGIESEKRCGGVILHSPFLSVCRVVVDMGFTIDGDLFPNIERVQHLGCPVFVIHGTADAVVPFSHGKKLYEALPPKYRATPFWADNLGHNDIELHQPRQFIKELRNFLTLASKSPRLQKSTKFGKFVGSSHSGTLRTLRTNKGLRTTSTSEEFYDEEEMMGESQLLSSPSSKTGSQQSRRPISPSRGPVIVDERGPSPVRERRCASPPSILRNGSGQSAYARDVRQGRNDFIVPVPPPSNKLLRVQVKQGNGKRGPILGQTPTRSRSTSPVKRARPQEDKAGSKFRMQEQMIHARAMSSRSRR